VILTDLLELRGASDWFSGAGVPGGVDIEVRAGKAAQPVAQLMAQPGG
jgi:hypothetical protein